MRRSLKIPEGGLVVALEQSLSSLSNVARALDGCTGRERNKTKSHAGKYINLMVNYPFSVALVLASAAASAYFELAFSCIRKRPVKVAFELR